jgi:hypothetical protein
MAGRNPTSTRLPAKFEPIRHSLDGHGRFRLLAPAESILTASIQIVKLNTAHVAGFPDRVKWKRAPAGGSMLDRGPSITRQNENARLLRSKHLLAVAFKWHLNLCAWSLVDHGGIYEPPLIVAILITKHSLFSRPGNAHEPFFSGISLVDHALRPSPFVLALGFGLGVPPKLLSLRRRASGARILYESLTPIPSPPQNIFRKIIVRKNYWGGVRGHD